MMHVLVLEPFGGGSHATFYKGWARHSRHRFTICEQPANHWKWRSRHSALTFAEQAGELVLRGERFDAVFCSSMLELPVWRGLVGPELASLPCVTYFHENQFMYPLSAGQARDYHYAYSNLLTALAAEQIWFNSAFHLEEFYTAAQAWLVRMPDGARQVGSVVKAKQRSVVRPPGIELPESYTDACPLEQSRCAVPVIGWVARWEHDKAPERFAAAIRYLLERDVSFQLCLLGERFRTKQQALVDLETMAGDRIMHNGFASSAEQYWQLLSKMDLVVSTAQHEFFGIGIVEAMACGALPVVPNRLAYPEVLQLQESPSRQRYIYEAGAAAEQKGSLEKILLSWLNQDAGYCDQELVDSAIAYNWPNLAAKYDRDIEALCDRAS